MIDLRSDTVSRPTPAMREAMYTAEVGDDVFGDDPTVNALETKLANLLGKESALFLPSGTQSNLCALLAHCQRGDEYLVGDHAHTYMYEAGGGAVLGSIQPQPIATTADGMVDLDAAAAAVKPDDSHFARTRLLCIENTTDGRVLTVEQMWASREMADRYGLGLHLDGARLWNAAVALGAAPSSVAAPFDTVSVCLSKGLGAPMGSLLVGRADLISAARRWRKMLGGGMRQVGIVAAAGRYAVDHHIDRLAMDHDNALRLAAGLSEIDGVSVTSQATNMVFAALDHPDADGAALGGRLAERGIITRWSGRSTRLVTHLDVTAADIEEVIDAVAASV